ncbi:MAG: hypothetical protein A2521_09000 [Deltaproteobacteria bacterium RIFOXYD12_FULL_57_12]|nr:MAG: hypothetical protein A2521_09000 [Deltaproteobacteria bacterium RIFOXYD12_FULL_57_12]
MTTIYLNNLPITVSEGDIRELLEPFGAVQAVQIIVDRYIDQQYGFCFAEMANDEDAQQAISGLNGREYVGQTLEASETRPRSSDSRAGAAKKRW